MNSYKVYKNDMDRSPSLQFQHAKSRKLLVRAISVQTSRACGAGKGSGRAGWPNDPLLRLDCSRGTVLGLPTG